MCGIVGIVHRSGGPPIAPDTIQRMLGAIRHRGPDDEGQHIEGTTAIAMRRLSIIDLAGGHQPVYNEDGSIAIVFNGEIYNYRQLRDHLIARSHSLRSRSDTETIVHLYEDYGTACVERLRGMFAFALWDSRHRTLLLGRDRFGIKPLYVVQAPWGIAFSSELKALHAVGLTAEGGLNLAAIDSYLRLGYIPAPDTPFINVRKLLPGHTLQWNADTGLATDRKYWDLPTHSLHAPRDVEERVLAAIDDSVRAHLIADVPVAAFLSGGLDSSAVVSSMALAGERAHAFTARYHGSAADKTDETPLARELSARYGTRLTIVDIEPDIGAIFERIIYALDEPHADESSIPSWLIAEAVSREYKVALVGTGGDELFAGYHRHIGVLLSGAWGRAPRMLRQGVGAVTSRVREPRDGGLGVNRLKRFLRSGEGTFSARYFAQFTRLDDDLRDAVLSPAWRAEVDGRAAEAHWEELHRKGGSRAGLSGALYLDYKTYLPDDILALSDRTSMAHSLEVRVPFVDHELVEAVFPLPTAVKIGLLQKKRLLRRSLRPRLPAAHFDAPKRGFVGPTASWLRNELSGMLQDELSASRLGRLGYFNLRTVQQLFDDHRGRRHNREGILWELLCFSVWHRRYVEQPVPAYVPGAAVLATD